MQAVCLKKLSCSNVQMHPVINLLSEHSGQKIKPNCLPVFQSRGPLDMYSSFI